MIEVSISHHIDDFALEGSFQTAGRVVALVGASGAGKSTLVNIIAGLITPRVGRIIIDGELLFDTVHRVDVPVHKRGVGYVFQDGRLFPHMSVRGNLMYGYRGAGVATFDDVVPLLGLEHLLERSPRNLSGGEVQRVAIGRALLAGRRLLLMDEPLASLDEGRKADLIPYIAQLRDHVRVPIIYVSHALEEVRRLADDVVRVNAGRFGLEQA